ncbi:MAG: hypothetical protein AABM42_12045 [Actinomycetota bacterium]
MPPVTTRATARQAMEEGERPPAPNLVHPKMTTGIYHGGPDGFEIGMRLVPATDTGVEPNYSEERCSVRSPVGKLRTQREWRGRVT